MNRMVFLLFIFLISFPQIPLMSAEKEYPDIYSKEEKLKKEAKPDPVVSLRTNGIYAEYQKAQEALWKDYQKIRDEFINGYLIGKLQMTYEEFKLMEKSLRDKYVEARRELLNKYFNDKRK